MIAVQPPNKGVSLLAESVKEEHTEELDESAVVSAWVCSVQVERSDIRSGSSSSWFSSPAVAGFRLLLLSPLLPDGSLIVEDEEARC